MSAVTKYVFLKCVNIAALNLKAGVCSFTDDKIIIFKLIANLILYASDAWLQKSRRHLLLQKVNCDDKIIIFKPIANLIRYASERMSWKTSDTPVIIKSKLWCQKWFNVPSPRFLPSFIICELINLRFQIYIYIYIWFTHINICNNITAHKKIFLHMI